MKRSALPIQCKTIETTKCRSSCRRANVRLGRQHKRDTKERSAWKQSTIWMPPFAPARRRIGPMSLRMSTKGTCGVNDDQKIADCRRLLMGAVMERVRDRIPHQTNRQLINAMRRTCARLRDMCANQHEALAT